ncbi:MAG: putative ABC exporter domain-containing protein [Oscillospiraceae bacterium]|nr:putative ABC exporter domain-containing protein [Oscillospiraceae bacterium]
MNALRYIFIHDAKNKLIELRRKPGKLILYLLVIAAIAAVVLLSVLQDSVSDSYMDILWLQAVLMAFFLFTVFVSIKQGLAKGTTLFKMEDVNFLFVSPLNPRAILLHGVIRMMKTTILSSIFILFNSVTLRDMFGVSFSGVLLVFSAFVLTSVVSQLLTLVIYSQTNSRPSRQRFVKILTTVAFAPLVIGILWHINAAGMDVTAGLLEFMGTPIASFTPVVGWAAAGAIAFITGQYVIGALFFGITFAAGAALIAVIYIGNPDYYEDVLVATETAFEKTRDIAEGNIEVATASDKKVKVKATGVSGYGASAIFHRHIREAFRVNRFGLWGVSTGVLVVSAAVYALISNRIGYEGAEHLLTLLVMIMVAQFFMAGTGRGVKDSYSHYIYMIPESPLKKLIWSNLEVIFRVAVQNALVFVVAGIILGSNLMLIVLSIVVSTLLSFLIISISFLSMRFTGSHMSIGILSMIYILAIIIVLLPGIAGAIIAGVFIDNGAIYVSLVILAVWELIAGLGCFAASKGVLHNCDIPSLRQMGGGN